SAGRIKDRGVKQSRGAGRRRMAAFALPGVEPDVVVIAAGRNERRTRAEPLCQLEAEHAAIKPKRAVEIGDLEVDMPDSCAGNDGWIVGHAISPMCLANVSCLPRPARGARSARVAGCGGLSASLISGGSPSLEPSHPNERV